MTRDFDSSSNPDAQRTATYRQWPAAVGFITSNFAVGPGKLIAKLEEHGHDRIGREWRRDARRLARGVSGGGLRLAYGVA
jgi:hypothetical protein